MISKKIRNIWNTCRYGAQDAVHRFNVACNGSIEFGVQLGALTQEAIRSADYMRREYPGKTYGAMALAFSLTQAIHGVRTGSNSLVVSRGIAVASSTSYIVLADQRKAHEDEIDPQDEKVSLAHKLMHPHRYPYETLTTLGTGTSITFLVLAGSADQGNDDKTGYLLMSMCHIPAYLAGLVPEQEEPTEPFEWGVLNLPGIKQTVNFFETRNLFKTGAMYQAGVWALLGYDFWQAGGNPAQMTPEVQTAAMIGIPANIFYMSASKRKKEAHNDSSPDSDTGAGTGTGTKDLPADPHNAFSAEPS